MGCRRRARTSSADELDHLRDAAATGLVGTSAEIAEQLDAHVAFREIDEVALALSFTFEHEDHVQILTDIAIKLGCQARGL